MYCENNGRTNKCLQLQWCSQNMEANSSKRLSRTIQSRMHQIKQLRRECDTLAIKVFNKLQPSGRGNTNITLQNPVVWMCLRKAVVTRSSPYKRVVGGSMHQEVPPQYLTMSQRVRLPSLELSVPNSTTIFLP